MRKILHVAARDFLATVTTKGFIIALLLPPIFLAAVGVVFPRVMNDRAPRQSGQIAIVDPTGQVAAGLRTYLSPEAIAGRRAGSLNRAREALGGVARALPPAPAMQAIDAATGVPPLDVVELPADADLPREKQLLRSRDAPARRLSLIVVHPDAVVPAANNAFGTFDLFVRAGLDDRIEREILNGMDDAIVDARVRHEGLDRQHVDALTTVERPKSITVTDTERNEGASTLTRILPFAFTLLLMMSVMSSGQYLMTTTIEEKSSRTMEVLLSAVSPMQLMAGKILGQLGVGLVVLVLYASVGLLALFSMALIGLLDMSLLIYLLIFFLITYLIMGSAMAAVGSAVNELREAQALVMPITMMMMTPWLFWYPIVRDPNSAFSTVLSFIPPMNTLVMMLRLASTAPPPLWQVWLSIGIGAGAAGLMLWFASRVFRIGLLMYGRPPDFATLIRWARQAQ
ncbi:MAG TPA: ABC transporter permease [Vicinamibacterales bacterium]|jgi:ABC-type Na+ efflux pump permease subunit|nr:ABC transporter permease [Vicinamibacterales bacterium]